MWNICVCVLPADSALCLHAGEALLLLPISGRHLVGSNHPAQTESLQLDRDGSGDVPAARLGPSIGLPCKFTAEGLRVSRDHHMRFEAFDVNTV